jgi:hypothetical protein
MSTIQVDFQLPQKFDLHYIGSDGDRHRPIMIHRALFGSVERFFGVLVEHYAGAFPTWMAPVQARVLPVADAHQAYADEAAAQLRAAAIPKALLQGSSGGVADDLAAALNLYARLLTCAGVDHRLLIHTDHGLPLDPTIEGCRQLLADYLCHRAAVLHVRDHGNVFRVARTACATLAGIVCGMAQRSAGRHGID